MAIASSKVRHGMTETTGGSDVGRSQTRAVADGDAWRLYGRKWFTSAVGSQMALTLARFSEAPDTGPTRRYYQHINKFSAQFAFATDMAMLTLGGYLKKKESLSARLGDVVSAM